MDNEKIGAFIYELRKEKNMTQKDLAGLLGVTDKAVSKWERGLGYPDISIIQELSKVLDITVNELLNGAYSESAARTESLSTDDIVFEAIEYANTVKDDRWIKKLSLAVGMFLLFGSTVCVIVNISIEQRLTWALYPIGGSIVTWTTLMPLFFFRRNRIVFSLTGLFFSSLPYLFLIENLSGVNGWVIPVALPIAAVSYLSMLIIMAFYRKLKINNWFVATIGVFVFMVLDYLIDRIISRYTGVYQTVQLDFSIAMLFGALFLMIGIVQTVRKHRVNS